MSNLMGKVKEAQEKMKQAQENLVNIRVSAESGAGLVRATVNGQKQLINLEIDKDLIKPEEEFMLKDLIIAAVNKATQEAEIKAKEEIKKSTEGLLPNIPGFNFDGMM